MAVLLVLIGHFAWFPTGELGGAGVECFFVLSGRLMAELLIVRGQELPTFFARRASRLVPALAFYVLVMLIVLALVPSFGRDNALVGAAAAMGFFHNLLAPDQIVHLFEHTWSLAVEEHSYLFLAILTLATARSRRIAMIAAAGIALLAMLNGLRLSGEANAGAQYVYWRTDVRAAAIFLSFALHLWAVDHFAKARGRHWRFVSPLCLAIGLVLLVDTSWPAFARFGIGTALLAVAACTVEVADVRFRRLLEYRGLVWIGLMSYSLYLWQQPFFILTRLGLPLAIGLVLAAACAFWSFNCVERPARARLNALWAGRQAARARRARSAPAAA